MMNEKQRAKLYEMIMRYSELRAQHWTYDAAVTKIGNSTRDKDVRTEFYSHVQKKETQREVAA